MHLSFPPFLIFVLRLYFILVFFVFAGMAQSQGWVKRYVKAFCKGFFVAVPVAVTFLDRVACVARVEGASMQVTVHMTSFLLRTLHCFSGTRDGLCLRQFWAGNGKVLKRS